MLIKRWVLILMSLAAVAQISIPALMVFDCERILTDGIPNKIRTAPIDPNDPFRGKYISLNFDNNYIDINDDTELKRNDKVYVSFEEDSLGFATIKNVSKVAPSDHHNYIKTRVLRVSYYSSLNVNRVFIEFPFDRFYMKESKAPKAEALYNNRSRQDTVEVYALLMVDDGKFILKDVIYDGRSISDVVGE
jgi:uncharacterized membrane-anchored protein